MNMVWAASESERSGVADRLTILRTRTGTRGSETDSRLMAGLLASVEREAHVSQRTLASELGVALGLVNSYIKRCVKKGLIKVQEVPSRRYAYYLTPQGFAEKSRLTAEYLSWSLTFVRRARVECTEVLRDAQCRGWRNIGIAGGDELAEIAILCAAELGLPVLSLVDPSVGKSNLLGVPVVARFGELTAEPDGWIIANIAGGQELYDELVRRVGVAGVLVPPLLSVRLETGLSAS
jgi:DNA-binding MarR family transcriptional regulator